LTTINKIRIEDHFGLVWMVVNRYRFRCGTSLTREDLFQEGTFGLIRAAELFDPDTGFRFSTYALHWIRQSILRAIDNQSRTVRVPCHRLESMRKQGKTPARDVSLDAPLWESDNTVALLDCLSAPEPSEEIDTDYCPRLDRERVRAMLDSLTPQERDVLRGRFWQEDTLLEIGERYGVTRERIRQIEAVALGKLRAASDYGSKPNWT
jgi:RNA polymerase primary sigma factor